MRLVLLLTLLFALGSCGLEEKPEPPKEEPVKTRPNIRRKPTRMVASAAQMPKPLVIAVIDTGLTIQKNVKYKLCKFGHKNFTVNPTSVKVEGIEAQIPVDNHGHGTNIAGLIQAYAGDGNYCMVILKYYDPKFPLSDNLAATVKAMEYAVNIKVDIINYSGGGTEFGQKEQENIKKFLDAGGKVIAAAGNESSDIDQEGKHFFPAMSDSRVIVVGNAIRPSERVFKKILGVEVDPDTSEQKMKKAIYIDNIQAYPAPSSNYGFRVNRWEYGTYQVGLYGSPLTGTSQAAAIATGKIVKQECDK